MSSPNGYPRTSLSDIRVGSRGSGPREESMSNKYSPATTNAGIGFAIGFGGTLLALYGFKPKFIYVKDAEGMYTSQLNNWLIIGIAVLVGLLLAGLLYMRK